VAWGSVLPWALELELELELEWGSVLEWALELGSAWELG
jgi:hypothetical protein